MFRSNILRTLVFLALLAVISSAGAYGQITISGGLALSRMDATDGNYTEKGNLGLGGNVYVDYFLPINIPLSLGGEIGADSSSFTAGGETDTVMAVPILFRAAYHFDLFPRLDLYLVGKIGYAFGFITSGASKEDFDSAGGMAFGVDAGLAYYFSSVFGLFIEGGFDDYMVTSKFSYGGGSSYNVDTPFYRFVTLGISLKR
jgi:hypothetical protein